MLTERELQTLRNMGNEAEAAADEIARLRAQVLELEAVHEDASGAVLAERERFRAMVDAVRDANHDAEGAGTFRLLTPGQERAWLALMVALRA